MKKFLFLFFFVLFASLALAQQSYYLLKIDDFSTLPAKPFPGDTVNLIVNVENFTSNRVAFDVNAEAQLNPLLFNVIDVFESLGTMGSDSQKQAAFSFSVNEGVLPGFYRVPVKLTYNNSLGIVTDYFDVNLVVNECFDLDLKDLAYSPAKVYAGQNIVVSANVENICSGVARNVSVELAPVTNSSFDPFILLSSNVVELGNILPGQSENVSFVLQPISSAAPGIYVFDLEGDCLDCGDATSDKASFEVLGVPWIIVSGTDFSIAARKDSKELMQGDAFSFSVQLDNIGEEKAKAVKVRLLVDGGVVGSKESFIGNIDPDDSGSAIFDLVVNHDAELGDHNAVIVVEYIDEVNAEKTVQEDYSFFVNQRPAESPIFLILLLIVLLVVLYFVLKLVFRQLSLRKANLK